MAFDFSQIADKMHTVFDSDLMTISRKTNTVDGDGFEVETDPKTPIYEDLPCHISFKKQDNPDTANEPTKPVIMSLEIYCDTAFDVRNGDYVTATKRKADGSILTVYTGIASETEVYQGRKRFVVGIEKWI